MRFTFAAWAVSRGLIVVAFLAASKHPLAGAGNWDGAWYGSIALHGYGYAHHGGQSDIAFFPLFPMLSSLLVRTGIGWPPAGVVVNNVAFFAGLFVLYAFARERWSATTARWCVAVACALPLSLFASVAYREGLYILSSALALWWTLRAKYLAGALAAAAATATAVTGLALAAALIADAIVRRRGARGVAVATLSLLGIIAFAAFCFVRFGDPVAFAHAQSGWRNAGFDAAAWLRVIESLRTWDGFLRNVMVVVLVPVAVIAIALQHRTLGSLLTVYGVLALALILFAGEPISADRIAYAVLPVLIAYGRALQRVPVAGVALLTASLALLTYDAVQFARFHWVA